MNRLLGLNHPFFLPKSRRIAVTVILAAWTVVELLTGNPAWALVSGALALYCFYAFFIVFDPKDYQEADDG